jgi:hypothetical protein
MEANREHKSSVFTEFFHEKARLIELYNAVTNANYPADTDIQINTLKDALFIGRQNDISFLLDDTLIILVEHQSTINLYSCTETYITSARGFLARGKEG